MFTLFSNYNTFLVRNQELETLVDVSKSGTIRPWQRKASDGRVLADFYQHINSSKAIRLRNCASFLDFLVSENGKKALVRANFCRVRLCPMCVWRRTLKIFVQTSKIMSELSKNDNYSYLFLTLTMKNCKSEDLSLAVDEMMKAWHKLFRYKRFNQAVRGFYRGFEITHNLNVTSDSYDTFHPHFHCILAVDKGYFKSRYYLSQNDWTSLWAKALGVDYNPVVHVKRVKGNTAKAVAEIAKYAVKEEDYIIPDDTDMTLKTVELLDRVLDKRRFVSFGGIFKDVHKKLNLDDPEDGDLIRIDDEVDLPDYKLVTYVWHSGYRQYVKT